MDPVKKLVLLGVLLMIPVYFMFFSESSPVLGGGGFPEIPPGSYTGEVIWKSNDGRPLDQEQLHLGCEDGAVHFVLTGGSGTFLGPAPLSGSALTLAADGGVQFTISGESVRYGNYEGTISDGNRTGTWTAKVISSTGKETPPDRSAFNRLKMLRSEQAGVSKKRTMLKQKAAATKQEVQRLSTLILDSHSLKKDAEKQFRTLRQEVEQLNVQRDAALREMQSLQKKVALAQRVTAAGQLVSLSRKSLDREMRWFESMFKGSDILSGSTVGSEYERALLKVELRDQIVKHREIVSRLKELSDRRSLYDLPY